MKKVYITPAAEVINSGAEENLLLTISRIGMGEPVGEGEEITADSKAAFKLIDDDEE